MYWFGLCASMTPRSSSRGILYTTPPTTDEATTDESEGVEPAAADD